MKNLKERAETPLKMTPLPKASGWVDLLTGKSINLDDPKNGKCPKCGSHSVVSAYPSEENCLKCGWGSD